MEESGGPEVEGRNLEDLEDKLKKLLSSLKDWERKSVAKVGGVVVELVKMPKRESRKAMEPERLVLHIRLENSFRGIFIRDSRDLEDLGKAVDTKIVRDIARVLDKMNREKVIEYEL